MIEYYMHKCLKDADENIYLKILLYYPLQGQLRAGCF
jgi:hypothetical protein